VFQVRFLRMISCSLQLLPVGHLASRKNPFGLRTHPLGRKRSASYSLLRNNSRSSDRSPASCGAEIDFGRSPHKSESLPALDKERHPAALTSTGCRIDQIPSDVCNASCQRGVPQSTTGYLQIIVFLVILLKPSNPKASLLKRWFFSRCSIVVT